MTEGAKIVDLGDRRRKLLIKELIEARFKYYPLVEWNEWRAEVQRILEKYYGELPDERK